VADEARIARRLTFVNRYFWPDHSATAQLLSDLAFDLAASGHEVTVVTSRQCYEQPDADLPPFETVRGVEVIRVGGTRFGRGRILGRLVDYLSFLVGARRVLAGRVREGDVVVAKTDPPLLGAFLASTVCRRRGRLVQWLQDVFPEVLLAVSRPGLALAFPLRMLAAWRDRSLHRSHAVVVLGRAMADHVRARGVSSTRIVEVPNWCDPVLVKPMVHAENALRRDWEIDACFVVGYSGNLGRVHDVDGLLRAAERLRHDVRVRFLFIGGGARTSDAIARVQAAGLDNVSFRPYQPRERLSESLGAVDLHVVSQREDTEGLVMPSKFYGVLAAGRPVLALAAAGGELDDLVARYACGYRVASDDVDGIVAAIGHALADPGSLGEMGARARAAAISDCSRDIAVRRWRDVVHAVAAGGPIQ